MDRESRTQRCHTNAGRSGVACGSVSAMSRRALLAVRTPYNKKGEVRPVRQRRVHRRVWQDARGRFQSDGEWGSFVRFKTHDAGNGYDTVEWAAKQSGSTGRVATFGLRQILGHHERRRRAENVRIEWTPVRPTETLQSCNGPGSPSLTSWQHQASVHSIKLSGTCCNGCCVFVVCWHSQSW